jgi:hypothetical protein
MSPDATRQPHGGPLLRLPLVALGTILLLSAGQSARAGWQSGEARAAPFTRVIVVGVSPDPKQRCPFERFVVSRLHDGTTEAIASCDAVETVEPLTRESIAEAVGVVKADAVITTYLVSREWVAAHGGGMDTRGSASYKATDSGYVTGYYGIYGVPVVYADFQTAPPVTTLQTKAELTTNVYRTDGAVLVYTVDTKVKRTETRDQTLSTIAKGIVDRLRRDRVVR